VLEGLEKEARARKKGLWAEPQSVPPWVGRRRRDYVHQRFHRPAPRLTPPHGRPSFALHMEQKAQPTPKVFISYSHDSPDHKRWVAELATKLMNNGIDVILDQWELGLGDDVPKFMEKSVTEADRVLMICTEKYVHKANEGSGGVGYEAMIVTGELVQNWGTSKFIPVIRQGSAKPLVPTSVSTRLYVNLSHGQNYQEHFEQLVRDLHNAPRIHKPPLGQSPYSKAPAVAAASAATSDIIPLESLGAMTSDVKTTYSAALEAIRREDIIAWRTLIRDARKPIPEQLAIWRSKYERQGLASQKEQDRPKIFENLMNSAAEGIVIYAPLFSIALAGIVSGKTKFNNQVAILDEVLYPKGWNRSGSSDIVGLPEAVAFVYQALHGATCLITEQLFLALRLAQDRIGEGVTGKHSVPLYRTSEIVGWPQTLGGNSKIAWDFLWGLPDRWPWLTEIFGDADDYRVALCAYYMSLNILELADCIAGGHTEFLEKRDLRLNVPLRTPAMPEDIVRRAYRLLLRWPDQIRNIWGSRKIAEENIKELWPKWISHTARIMRHEYQWINTPMVQECLFDDLTQPL
jgi:hypothetical protein